MIDPTLSLLRFLGGLGMVVFLGYALLAAALPQPREFRPLERLAFSFGAGVVLLTLWMLALTWRGHPYGLALILGPLLVLAAALLLTPRGRRACLARPAGASNHPGLSASRAGTGSSSACWR